MKYKEFSSLSRTNQQAYFKDGIEMIYASQQAPLKIAILPAYDPNDPDPTAWIPSITGDEESDFYCAVRAAKFVGHGNRRCKTAFISPKTFLGCNAVDPYEAFFTYCSGSEKWSYLTENKKGKRLNGEPDGAVFTNMRTMFVANVMDMSVGSRGGVFVTELSETVLHSILYAERKNGPRVDGIVFKKDSSGNHVYDDITNPKNALVIEIAWTGNKYIARPALDGKGCIMRTEIPETLLRHRRHMEDPDTFLIRPESNQAIVDRIAGMLRGYKRPGTDEDEINALKEAMEFFYGKGAFVVEEEASDRDDQFADAAKSTVEAEPEKKAEAVDDAVNRALKHERYVPVDKDHQQKPKRKKVKPIIVDDVENKVVPMTADPYRDDAPGEDIDPSDIASLRAMLSGKK